MRLWQVVMLRVVSGRSLRRRAEQRVDSLFGPVPLRERLSAQARLISLAALIVAIGTSAVLPLLVPLDVTATFTKSDIVAVLASSWGVGAGLFALIAAVTALLLNLATDVETRSRLIREYRRRGFDVVAAMSLTVLLWTGAVVLHVAAIPTTTSDITLEEIRFDVGSWALMMTWDVVGLTWLLIYSHVLLGQSLEQQKEAIRAALKMSFREEAVTRVSVSLLDEWAATRGLETQMMFGFAATGSPVLSIRGGVVRDIDLGFLGRVLSGIRHRLHGDTRAQLGLTLGRDVPAGAQIGCLPVDDAAKGTKVLRAVIWK